MSKLKLSIIAGVLIAAAFFLTADAQLRTGQLGSGVSTLDNWKVVSSTALSPRIGTFSVRIPYLGGTGARCVHTDNAGNLSTSTADCGTGGSGGASSSINGATSPFTFTTSSDTNLGLGIATSTGQLTFTPFWIGTLADARITSAAIWNSRTSTATSTLSGLNSGTYKITSASNLLAVTSSTAPDTVTLTPTTTPTYTSVTATNVSSTFATLGTVSSTFIQATSVSSTNGNFAVVSTTVFSFGSASGFLLSTSGLVGVSTQPLLKSNNLSDLVSPNQALSNLGGASSTISVTTTVSGGLRGGGTLTQDRGLFMAAGNNSTQNCAGILDTLTPSATISCHAPSIFATTTVSGTGNITATLTGANYALTISSTAAFATSVSSTNAIFGNGTSTTWFSTTLTSTNASSTFATLGTVSSTFIRSTAVSSTLGLFANISTTLFQFGTSNGFLLASSGIVGYSNAPLLNSNNLVDLAASTTARTNLGIAYPFSFVIENPTSTENDVVWTPRVTSTIKECLAVHKGGNNTISWNLGFASSTRRDFPSSTLWNIFASTQTTTASTTASDLIPTGSTTISGKAPLILWASAASSTQFSFTCYYTEN